MHIERLDHVNIQTHDLVATCDFYVEVIGLRVGERPPFGFPGYWLYDDRLPVIHLTGLVGDGAPDEKNAAVNHIAFRAAGLTALRERLTQRRIAAFETVVPRNGDVQIFVRDPNGVSIELNFAAAEARDGEALGVL